MSRAGAATVKSSPERHGEASMADTIPVVLRKEAKDRSIRIQTASTNTAVETWGRPLLVLPCDESLPSVDPTALEVVWAVTGVCR